MDQAGGPHVFTPKESPLVGRCLSSLLIGPKSQVPNIRSIKNAMFRVRATLFRCYQGGGMEWNENVYINTGHIYRSRFGVLLPFFSQQAGDVASNSRREFSSSSGVYISLTS